MTLHLGAFAALLMFGSDGRSLPQPQKIQQARASEPCEYDLSSDHVCAGYGLTWGQEGVGGSGEEGLSCEHDAQAKHPCADLWMLDEERGGER